MGRLGLVPLLRREQLLGRARHAVLVGHLLPLVLERVEALAQVAALAAGELELPEVVERRGARLVDAGLRRTQRSGVEWCTEHRTHWERRAACVARARACSSLTLVP